MSEETIISKIRQLVTSVEREIRWITTIGLMGIAFAILFAVTMTLLRVLLPLRLMTRAEVIPIVQGFIWVFAIFSVISIVASVKVLKFVRNWRTRYATLKAAEKELEKRYFTES